MDARGLRDRTTEWPPPESETQTGGSSPTVRWLFSYSDRCLESYTGDNYPFRAALPVFAAGGDGPLPSRTHLPASQGTPDRLYRPDAVEILKTSHPMKRRAPSAGASVSSLYSPGRSGGVRHGHAGRRILRNHPWKISAGRYGSGRRI